MQTIHIKCEVLFSYLNRNEYFKMSSAAVANGTPGSARSSPIMHSILIAQKKTTADDIFTEFFQRK